MTAAVFQQREFFDSVSRKSVTSQLKHRLAFKNWAELLIHNKCQLFQISLIFTFTWQYYGILD